MAQRPEIVIGLIGAVGTDLKQAVEALAHEFGRIGYAAHQVRMSALLAECAAFSHLGTLAEAAEDMRIDAHMEAGDRLRMAAGRGDALIYLAIAHIRALRRALGAAEQALPDTVYILNSLKHPQEVETLRRIYGHNFLAVALYEPKQKRKDRLQGRIAQSRRSMNQESFATQAQYLIDKDEKEAGTELGQNVRGTFPLADLFVSAGDKTILRDQFGRFVDLLFGSPFITPTEDEYGMFHAKATALRSADLSRQVGALLTTPQGEIIAAGCNEVPRPGGGIAWTTADSASDRRDFQVGYDTSTRMKHEIVEEILHTLTLHQWLDKDLLAKHSLQQLVHQAVFDDNAILGEARVSNLIEFGRMVHAEMNALMEAARRGLPVQGARLYCTTFPCHMCARHIIAAGISEVIYIEPYPKSMAEQLYQGAISVDGKPADSQAVHFRPFIGVAPRRFQHLFEKGKRKDHLGNRIEWAPASARPLLADNFFIYLDTEETYTTEMDSPALGQLIHGGQD